VVSLYTHNQGAMVAFQCTSHEVQWSFSEFSPSLAWVSHL